MTDHLEHAQRDWFLRSRWIVGVYAWKGCWFGLSKVELAVWYAVPIVSNAWGHLLRIAVAFDGQQMWGDSWTVLLGWCLDSTKCKDRSSAGDSDLQMPYPSRSTQTHDCTPDNFIIFYSFWSPLDSNSTICVKSGYLGRFDPNFSSIVRKDTVDCGMPTKYRPTNFGMKMPPLERLRTQLWRRQTDKYIGLQTCSKFITFFPSTRNVHWNNRNLDWVRRASTKGALTGDWNEKPKTASKTHIGFQKGLPEGRDVGGQRGRKDWNRHILALSRESL